MQTPVGKKRSLIRSRARSTRAVGTWDVAQVDGKCPHVSCKCLDRALKGHGSEMRRLGAVRC